MIELEPQLVDRPAREAIRCALDRTLLVEAAAGTGKTTELVGRVLQVILTGAGSLGSIAALTFTEKAAGELKLRLRTELDRALGRPDLAELARQRARRALSELETANIGTIHGFCAEMLLRYPVEAEIDPAFEVAEPERERALLAEVFDGWLASVLDDPPEGVRRVLARRAVSHDGKSPEQQLLAAARQLIETRDFGATYNRPVLDRAAELASMETELQALAAFQLQGSDNDPLCRTLKRLARELEELSAELDAREAQLRRMARDRDLWSGQNGRGQLYARGVPRQDVLARREQAAQNLVATLRLCDAEVAACLSEELRAVVQLYAAAKHEAGVLDFFDLLLCMRRLLSQVPAVRRELQAAFSHVFVDEFQDTDPVQSEIVLLLCADDPRQSEPWRTRPVPGKLFLVGDPKQSIYRFRRADIALYERVKRHLLEAGAQVLQLTTSFRALPEIQACVNAAFTAAMRADSARGQADYVPLHAYRSARSDQPALVALPVPSPYGYSGRVTKRAINASLPEAVGAWLEWLLRDSGYVVREHGRDVPVAARHVCLLFKRFRSWEGEVTRPYVRALEARGVPHVLSGGRTFHDREEVLALRSVLTAIEWPDDLLHVYATLRGPFVAFHDETLFSFRERAGHLHPLRPQPEPLDTLSPDEQAVAELLRLLASLHKNRNRVPIAHTISRFLSHVRAHAGLSIWPGGEQALANVLRLQDFARSYERRTKAGSFRGFVEWLSEQADEAQTAEAAVTEERSDGVRLLTVHAAKGLEFPVVVLCDPTAPARQEHASRYLDPERGLWAQSLCESEPIELWEQRDVVREHDAAEIVRLLYVAATRAQELLVVPVCGDGPIEGWLEVLSPALYPPLERCRTSEPSAYRLPSFGADSVAQRQHPMPAYSVAPGVHVPERGEQRVVFWDPGLLEHATPARAGVAQMHLLQSADGSPAEQRGSPAYRAFRERSDAARANASARSLTSSSMTQHAASGVPYPTTTPFSIVDTGAERSARPRGTRFGSLVHALFEHLDYSQREPELARVALGLARMLGADDAERESAVQCVRAALGHAFFEAVRAAAVRGELYRELPVLLRAADGNLFDGVIDLAFVEATAAGRALCVVDFKTDVELSDPSHYATQLGMYADAASQALGLPVRSVLLRV